MSRGRNLNRKVKIFLWITGAALAPVIFSPLPRFRSPLSTVVVAADSSLLGARIADDGQWRFPDRENVPYKFEKSLLTFEDKYFYYHPGINPVSIFHAVIGNFKAGKIVSGGSTITMQVARISRPDAPRTYIEKIAEMLSALKLELFRTKRSILRMYVANAPFGGNTVGLEAAAWRYTGKSSDNLSWAEAAALAVLPNSPSLVYPGKNQEILKTRRDKLLTELYKHKDLDSLTLVLALEEPLPGEPIPLPSKAPHLTDQFYVKNRGTIVQTTIDPFLQEKATEIINSHQKDLAGNYIFNSACIIIEVESGNVLAYVGNSTNEETQSHCGAVDIIQSSRSTGSILKPFLYAGIQNSGDFLPDALIADIPTRFPGFSPKNFSLGYSGAVPAASALSQSLNIPAVKMLQKYSPEKFLDLLQKTGFTTFRKPAEYYGLSIILGGGETSLWELSGAYASLSRVLNRYQKEKKYIKEDYHEPVLVKPLPGTKKLTEDLNPPLSASSIWLTYQALLKVNRPDSESGWQYFSSSPDLAWKTGTSFGFRDGWAVGTTPGYVIGVWTGNADGEGRPGLTGITTAAPILFHLVSYLKTGSWFKPPYEELTKITVCSKSGYRAGPNCPETIEVDACVSGLKSEACSFHQIVHLDKQGTHRINSDCANVTEIANQKWFILPPAMEYYYLKNHPDYNILPPMAGNCPPDKIIPVMEFIYPSSGIRIFTPRDETGNVTKVIAEIVHRNSSKKVFWHLDEQYITTTKRIHQTELDAKRGNHTLTVVDEDGNSLSCKFTIV
jgi:penicillin-binding protein 1C